MERSLLAEHQASAGGVAGHGLHGRKARHPAGHQRQKNETQENAAEKFGIRLNSRTHLNPRKFAASALSRESPYRHAGDISINGKFSNR
jgi:hypothetical protein